MTEDIFIKNYYFYGKHGRQIDELKNEKLFKRLMDVYLVAPIIGFIYKRNSPKDKSDESKNILTETLIKEVEKIKYNYRLIMLLDEEYESDFNKRVDKAFRYIGGEKSLKDFERFNSYVRGGIEILYENIIEKSPTQDDYIKNYYEFIKKFQAVYNEDIQDLTTLYK